jgi:WD40 repeat protein
MVACSDEDNKVVILDLETRAETVIKVKMPGTCAASREHIAFTTNDEGIFFYTHQGELLYGIPDLDDVCFVAFDPRDDNCLAIGLYNGVVGLWDVSKRKDTAEHKAHRELITSLHFAEDGRIFSTSEDQTAAIVKFDDQLKADKHIRLRGHTARVNDILPLLAWETCATCADDDCIRIWDCKTGKCLRTLTQDGPLFVLRLCPDGQRFVCASWNNVAVVWSCESFEQLQSVTFPEWSGCLLFNTNSQVFTSHYTHGVMRHSDISHEKGDWILPGAYTSLALCMSLFLSLTASLLIL